MQETLARLRKEIYDEMDLNYELEDDELRTLIAACVKRYASGCLVSLQERAALEKRLFDSFRQLDILQELLEDAEITEIMVNGAGHIFYEKEGSLYEWEKTFESEEKLLTIIQTIVGRANRRVNESQPIVDTRLADGSRVNIIVPPIALDGPSLSIRKFSKSPMTMERLVAFGSLSEQMAQSLQILVAAGYNIFVSGGTGSGKTTFLNALSQYIPSDQRVVTIEDSAELQMKSVRNLVRLETRSVNENGTYPITIRDLIRTALRMRPDRIIVGEVRGPEALDMLQANNTGHNGSMSTGHANSGPEMLRRLETMVLMGMDLPMAAIRAQIAYGLDILIHLGRMRDRSRRVLEIHEITGMRQGEIQTSLLYRFEEEMAEDESPKKKGIRAVRGSWHPVQPLQNREKLLAAGLEKEYADVEQRNG